MRHTTIEPPSCSWVDGGSFVLRQDFLPNCLDTSHQPCDHHSMPTYTVTMSGILDPDVAIRIAEHLNNGLPPGISLTVTDTLGGTLWSAQPK